MQPLNVVITGGSSGLGEALAYRYARDGARIAVFARRRERLQAVADRCLELGATDAIVLVGDTTIRDDVTRVIAELDAHWDHVDRAFLNAGGSADKHKAKRFEHYLECCTADDLSAADFSADSAEWVMRLNYLGTVYWLEAILARMRERRSGTITVTGSLAADGLLPRSGPYMATKSALRSLLLGLRHDAHKFGVNLCLVECGWFVSELTDPKSSAPFLMTAEATADRVHRGTERREAVMRFPWRLAVGNRLMGFLPRRLLESLWDRKLPRLDLRR